MQVLLYHYKSINSICSLLICSHVFLFVQWFGNLVTMEWWNDLWLNEGFAKFMEYISLDITYPELQVVRDQHRKLDIKMCLL